MNTITQSAPTLEQKIVKALADDTMSARDIGFLSATTEGAITTAENDAKVAETIALDPLQSPDLHAARATVEDAKFRASRLRSLQPRLEERYEQMAHKEKKAAWLVRYGTLRTQHDALEEEMKSAYAECVAKLLPVLQNTLLLNAEISHLNQSQVSNTLGSDGGWLTAIETPKQLVLPDPESNKNFWPPVSNIDWSAITPIISHPGDHWWEVQQAEAQRARIEDNKRADAREAEESRIANDPRLWKKT
jgi:hypothetical protein